MNTIVNNVGTVTPVVTNTIGSFADLFTTNDYLGVLIAISIIGIAVSMLGVLISRARG